MNIRQLIPLGARLLITTTELTKQCSSVAFKPQKSMVVRRSQRLKALHATAVTNNDLPPGKTKVVKPRPSSKKRKEPNSTDKKSRVKKEDAGAIAQKCLPRTLEAALKTKYPHIQKVIGIDEAGRGPLAGPVVAAAVWAPADLDGIVDSKKITKEEERERLYEELIQMPNIEWAVAVMDAQRIDEINILQATLEGMRLCATTLSNPNSLSVPVHAAASIEHSGCYIVTSTANAGKEGIAPESQTTYALIDGNKVPKDMPCSAESVVKGDGKEFAIAAASIFAKVTRDRLMHAYDSLYPEYNLKQHKGYPTADHMKAVAKFGASPIHRRTFAPLKHMEFDENGKVIQ